MGSPEDRLPHEGLPHKAPAPPWLRTPGIPYPQPPGSFWAEIEREKVIEWAVAYAGSGYATLNLVEMLGDASEWSARAGVGTRERARRLAEKTPRRGPRSCGRAQLARSEITGETFLSRTAKADLASGKRPSGKRGPKPHHQ